MGLTRLELSIHEAALIKQHMLEPSIKIMFHKRIADCMQDFTVRLINEKEVWSQCYRRVPVSKVLALLAMAPVNILAVGKNESWMINASTPHKRHFVGSSCSNKLYDRPSEMT